MLRRLLPSSSLDRTPLPAPIVVLHRDLAPWLRDTLKRIRRENGFKPYEKPLNSVEQCRKFLTDILSNKSAIWNVADALFDQRTIEIKTYIVSIDMVSRNETAYRLTAETSDALIQYHKEVHCVLGRARYAEWPGKEQQIKEQHEKFATDINNFRFYSDVRVLKNLQANGAGELPLEKQLEIKTKLMSLLKPLSPPTVASDVSILPPLWPKQQMNPHLANCYTAINLIPVGTAILPSEPMNYYSNKTILAGNSVPFPSTLIQNLPRTADCDMAGGIRYCNICGINESEPYFM